MIQKIGCTRNRDLQKENSQKAIGNLNRCFSVFVASSSFIFIFCFHLPISRRCATVQPHFVDIVLCRIHKYRRWFLGHSMPQLRSVCVRFVQRTVATSNISTNTNGRAFAIRSNVSANIYRYRRAHAICNSFSSRLSRPTVVFIETNILTPYAMGLQ